MDYSAEVAKKLLQINAIKLSPAKPFRWASGMRSPIYCDNRISLSYPEARNMVKAGLLELSNNFNDFDVLAGVATAGIPHGALLADALEKPYIYVRAKAKSHGRQNQIEGRLQEGQKVLLVEDLISTGGSSIAAVNAVRDAGGLVQGVMAIFSYGFDKAKKNFDAADCKFDTITDYDTLLTQASKDNYITDEELSILKKWRVNPESWYTENFKKED